jgi:DNA invertase Pin-like site-specific DNA recombinase
VLDVAFDVSGKDGMRMLIGYARVSTDDPHLELQRDALVEAEYERVFENTASSAKSE